MQRCDKDLIVQSVSKVKQRKSKINCHCEKLSRVSNDNISMKCSRVLFDFVCWLAVVGSASGSGLYGRVQNLSFVPDAATKPQDKHEIPASALFQFLLDEEIMEQLDEAGAEIPEMLDVLKDLDKESEITEFEIHQINRTGKVADLKKVAFHTFVVFKTTSETEGDDWWSLEKNNLDSGLVLQRSGNKDDVKNKLHGVERINVEPIQKGLKGKGTIQDLFVLLWIHQVMGKNSDIDDSYCQTFVTLVSQQMTEIGYEYQGDFECSSPLENGRKTRLLTAINYLSDVTEWRPLEIFIYFENADLVDQVLMESGEFDIDDLRREITSALHFAIMFSKTAMVGHLLKPPHSADPTRSGKDGMDALRMAGTFAKDPEIFDLLLAHDNIEIDRVDREGLTALHAAASTSNVVAVKHLINKGAHPNMFDIDGLSPLHVAAHYRDGNPIIDLLLEAQKVKGMGGGRRGGVDDPNEKGMTALHYAAVASNEITAEHLIQKGADLNRRADDGNTPLHLAATFAKNMNIIDVLLKNVKNKDINTNDAKAILASAERNMHGLGDQIVARLKAKGIVGIDESQKPEMDVEMIRLLIKTGRNIGTQTFGENEMNLLHVVSFSAKTTDVIDAVLETGEFDINGVDNDGNTPLHYAMQGNNPTIIVAHLLQKGADPNVADKYGFMPLNVAVFSTKDVHLVELLLNHPDVDVNDLDDWESNALDYAKGNKHGHGERIANLLKAKGAVKRENKKPDAMARVLDRAVKDSNVELIRALIKNGLKISTEKWGESRMNLLHSASFHAKTTDVIDIILETGEFDINGGDNDGLTPLHHALLGLYPKRNVAHLIQLGADPNVADKNGVTALNMAARNAESMHLIELLLLNREAVGVGCCDKQEYYFYPTNVCLVNS